MQAQVTRSLKEAMHPLNYYCKQYTDFISELKENYPGFCDPTYMDWLKTTRNNSTWHKFGEPIPDVEYLQQNKDTWKVLYNELRIAHQNYASKEHLDNLKKLEDQHIFSASKIPTLQAANKFISKHTGFELYPVGGMVNSRTFFAGLAYRKFYATQYLRHNSSIYYSPEPDMVHDMMGHAPLLGNADIADIYELFGKKSLKASDEVIEILGKLYFYCLEFGVLGNGKILGAGILGSSKETNHVGANDVKLKDFNFDDICNEEYVISDFQPYYYNIGSIKSLFKSLKVEFNKF